MPYLPGLIHKRSGETKFFISLKTWRKCNPLSVVLQVLSFKKYSINPFRSNNSRYCLNGIWLREALERISVCRTFWPLAASKIKAIISTRLLYCFTHTRTRICPLTIYIYNPMYIISLSGYKHLLVAFWGYFYQKYYLLQIVTIGKIIGKINLLCKVIFTIP